MMLNTILSDLNLGSSLRALLLVALGFLIAKVASSSFNKAFGKRLTLQQAMLLRRIIFYVILVLFIASAVQQLGFRISTLLGATGILTVAIGIASQNSMSNIISGLFIIGEKPFEIGNTIKINDIQGEVIAIDFLSVKVRTAENTMVRIPSEVLIKTAITNISYFPIRRIDFALSVAYNSDLDLVKRVLFAAAEKNPFCLNDPQPSWLILGFGVATVSIQFSAWTTKQNYSELKNTLQTDIKTAFLHNHIEMRFSAPAILHNYDSAPLPIKIITDDKG